VNNITISCVQFHCQNQQWVKTILLYNDYEMAAVMLPGVCLVCDNITSLTGYNISLSSTPQ